MLVDRSTYRDHDRHRRRHNINTDRDYPYTERGPVLVQQYSTVASIRQIMPARLVNFLTSTEKKWYHLR